LPFHPSGKSAEANPFLPEEEKKSVNADFISIELEEADFPKASGKRHPKKQNQKNSVSVIAARCTAGKKKKEKEAGRSSPAL